MSKKMLKWIVVLSSILIIPFNSYCQDNDVPLTMPLSDAKKIVVNLEKSNLYQQEIDQLENGNKQLIEQNGNLLKQINVLKDELKIKDDQINIARKQIDDQKKIYEDKVKACEETKPSVFNKISGILGGFGLGILVGLFL